MAILSQLGDSYPTIEEIFNQTRVFLNDTFAGATGTVGEGRVFTDSWTPSITILNTATQQLQRDLQDACSSCFSTTKNEIFYSSLPPINGALGPGIPDATVQVYLSYQGFWDGSILHNSPPSPSLPNGGPALPLDLLQPLKLEQRDAGSNTDFTMVSPATDGLPSMFQSFSLGYWEWRGDAIYMNGALTQKDIRLRYVATILPKFPLLLSPSLFPTTYIPFADSGDALAYKCAYIFSSPRVAQGGANELLANYNDAKDKIANRIIKQAQREDYHRQEFGAGNEYGSTFGW